MGWTESSSLTMGDAAKTTDDQTIDALPEIIAAVNGRMTVIIDSGFRRGTDVVKALAMGAHAAGIGRPYLWGLGAFGRRALKVCSTSSAPRRVRQCSNAAFAR